MVLECFLATLMLAASSSGEDGLTLVTQEKEGTICFEVRRPTSSDPPWWLTIKLLVQFPQTMAEAGEAVMGVGDLSPGNHNLYYQYLVTNLTHDVYLSLDGEKKKFIKSIVPRWSSTSSFYQISFTAEGDVMSPLSTCYEEKTEKSIKTSTPNEAEKSTNSIFRYLEDSTMRNIKEKHFTATEKTFNSRNDSLMLASSSPPPRNTSALNEDKSPRPSTSRGEEIKAPRTGSYVSLNNSARGSLVPTIVPYVEMSHECLPPDCISTPSHDYTMAYALFAVVGCLIVAAIVISIVFHRKKKHLMNNSYSPTDHRLREKLFDEERDEGRSHIVFHDLENIYEQMS